MMYSYGMCSGNGDTFRDSCLHHHVKYNPLLYIVYCSNFVLDSSTSLLVLCRRLRLSSGSKTANSIGFGTSHLVVLYVVLWFDSI